MKRNGDAYGGRLKGVRPVSEDDDEPDLENREVEGTVLGSGFDPEASPTAASLVASVLASSASSASSSTGSGRSCKKRIAFGSTEIMSPGARRVLGFVC